MSRDKKTLVIFTPGFPENESDTTCLPFPQLFVKTLAQSNPSLQVIVLAFQYPFTNVEYQWYGVTVIPFNGQSKGRFNRLMVWRAAWKRFNLIKKETNVSGVLNFWLGECGLVGKWAAKRHHLPHYTWLLGQDARKHNRYFYLIQPAAQSLVALSDFLAAECYRNYGIMPSHIVPPGIDSSSFSTEPAVRDIDVLGVGSLIPLKQYNIFIDIVAELVKTKPGIRTMICGKGVQQEQLQQLINDADLSANIELCGEKPHAETLQLMQRSKVLLHPSSYEGFATVLAEALYAGAPVVAFCRPMKTVFQNQHVVENVADMTAKVKELLADKNLLHEKIITWPISETCKKISALFGI